MSETTKRVSQRSSDISAWRVGQSVLAGVIYFERQFGVIYCMAGVTFFGGRLIQWTRLLLIQKRYRYKRKWASYDKKKTSCDHALEYFDQYYLPVYGKQWRSMRIALLSRSKHCALVNNYANVEDVTVDLLCGGADDMLKTASMTNLPDEIMESDGRVKIEQLGNVEHDNFQLSDSEVDSPTGSAAGKERTAAMNKLVSSPDHVINNTNIHEFMPATRIVSSKEELFQQDLQQGFFEPDDDLPVKMIYEGEPRLPPHLRIFTHPRGVVERFPPPKRDSSGKVDYYLMDAGSILPVIALGLEPDDRVLDMCAAPGGKCLTALQTMLPDKMVCMDVSVSRCRRLKDMLHQYLPRSYFDEGKLDVSCADSCDLWEHTPDGDHLFDKVLVDVPCYTDRHVLNEEDNNLFKPGRIRERLELQNIQKMLLCSALKMCKPGGSVVYSTCTLSLPQNDGVVQASLEHIWNETDMEVGVVDTSVMTHRFSQIFDFYRNCRFGQLVVPNLTANFGPTYFCKLRRLK